MRLEHLLSGAALALLLNFVHQRRFFLSLPEIVRKLFAAMSKTNLKAGQARADAPRVS